MQLDQILTNEYNSHSYGPNNDLQGANSKSFVFTQSSSKCLPTPLMKAKDYNFDQNNQTRTNGVVFSQKHHLNHNQQLRPGIDERQNLSANTSSNSSIDQNKSSGFKKTKITENDCINMQNLKNRGDFSNARDTQTSVDRSKNFFPSFNNGAQYLFASSTKATIGHDERVQCVTFGFDSNNFITAGHDSRILIWSRHHQISKLVGIIELSSKFVMACDISPNSSIIAAGGLNNRCSLYLYTPNDPVQTKPVREFMNIDYMLSGCKFLSNTNIICSHGNQVFLHDVAETTNNTNSQSLLQINCHRKQISAIDVYENYPYNFLTCSSDKFVKLWDIRSQGCKMKQKNISEVNCLKVCRSRPNLFATSLDYTITLSDIRYPTPLITFRTNANVGEITNIEMSNCGRYIFSTDDKGIFAAYDVLNIESSTNSSKLLNMLNERLCMSMSPDGQCFVIGTSNSDVYLSQVINKIPK